MPDKPAVVDIADYVVMGAAEKSFRDLCRFILFGNKPSQREIQSDELLLDLGERVLGSGIDRLPEVFERREASVNVSDDEGSLHVEQHVVPG